MKLKKNYKERKIRNKKKSQKKREMIIYKLKKEITEK